MVPGWYRLLSVWVWTSVGIKALEQAVEAVVEPAVNGASSLADLERMPGTLECSREVQVVRIAEAALLTYEDVQLTALAEPATFENTDAGAGMRDYRRIEQARSREWVVLKTPRGMTVQEAFDAVRPMGPVAMIAAGFVVSRRRGLDVAVLARKPRASRFNPPAGWQLCSLGGSRAWARDVVQNVHFFLQHASQGITTIASDAVVAEAPIRFQEIMEFLTPMNGQEFQMYLANARLAVADRTANTMQRKVAAIRSDVMEWFRAKEFAKDCCHNFDAPGEFDYPLDFNECAWNMVGVKFQNDEIRESTLDEFWNSLDLISYSAFFVGDPGIGKTKLLHALGRKACRMLGLPQYFMGKGIDPMGELTRQGVMSKMAAVILTDFELVSRLRERLSTSQVKMLLDCEEVPSIFCRHHLALIPSRRPRLFAANTGLTAEGHLDYGHWFRQEGVPILADLVNRDAAAIRRYSADDRAVLRRTIIFRVTERLVREETLEDGRQALAAQVQAMVQRERTLFPHLVRP